MKSRGQVVITGATSGIGFATAELFAARGYELVLTGRRKPELASLKDKLISDHGAAVEIVPFDVSSRKSAEDAVSQHKALFAKTTVLVNNAGLALGYDKFQDIRLDDADKVIDTNVKGIIYLTRLLLPSMIEAKDGHIVNIGSINGRWSFPSAAVYGASKFAVRALTECLRQDLIGTPIRVTNIEPGAVDTDFWQVRFKNSEQAKTFKAGWEPLNPADIAEAVVWCTERPKHVNVQELVVFPTQQVVGNIARDK